MDARSFLSHLQTRRPAPVGATSTGLPGHVVPTAPTSRAPITLPAARPQGLAGKPPYSKDRYPASFAGRKPGAKSKAPNRRQMQSALAAAIAMKSGNAKYEADATAPDFLERFGVKRNVITRITNGLVAGDITMTQAMSDFASSSEKGGHPISGFSTTATTVNPAQAAITQAITAEPTSAYQYSAGAAARAIRTAATTVNPAKAVSTSAYQYSAGAVPRHNEHDVRLEGHERSSVALDAVLTNQNAAKEAKEAQRREGEDALYSQARYRERLGEERKQMVGEMITNVINKREWARQNAAPGQTSSAGGTVPGGDIASSVPMASVVAPVSTVETPEPNLPGADGAGGMSSSNGVGLADTNGPRLRRPVVERGPWGGEAYDDLFGPSAEELPPVEAPAAAAAAPRTVARVERRAAPPPSPKPQISALEEARKRYKAKFGFDAQPNAGVRSLNNRIQVNKPLPRPRN